MEASSNLHSLGSGFMVIFQRHALHCRRWRTGESCSRETPPSSAPCAMHRSRQPPINPWVSRRKIHLPPPPKNTFL